MSPDAFYLGTHNPAWLGTLGVPLCVSRVRMVKRKSFPRALKPWMFDSGAFSEIAKHGRWTVTAKQYAGEVALVDDEVGQLVAVAPQDWMCEPHMLRKTGLTVRRHQELTTRNFLELRDLGVNKVFPVLQGFKLDEYMARAEMYERAGVRLASLPVVGVGSVCRRQAEDEISAVLHTIAETGVKIHGFGVKLQGLRKAACALVSADSMAWSFCARRDPPLAGCTTHINCANCDRYALVWRQKVVEAAEHPLCARC